MGYHNVMWGSDYPHLEGTFGHTQKILHELFDDVDEDARYRITRGRLPRTVPPRRRTTNRTGLRQRLTRAPAHEFRLPARDRPVPEQSPPGVPRDVHQAERAYRPPHEL